MANSSANCDAFLLAQAHHSTYNTTHQDGPFGWEASWEFLFVNRTGPLCRLIKEWWDGCALPQRLPRIPAAWSALSRKSLGDGGTPSPGIGSHPQTYSARVRTPRLAS